MTIYLVRAKPKRDLMVQLDNRLQSGKILQMKPFGKALQYGLQNAKIDRGEGYAYWKKKITTLHHLLWKERQYWINTLMILV